MSAKEKVVMCPMAYHCPYKSEACRHKDPHTENHRCNFGGRKCKRCVPFDPKTHKFIVPEDILWKMLEEIPYNKEDCDT